ncbi:5'-3' exonuclease, partial [Corynebacterium dentalis]
MSSAGKDATDDRPTLLLLDGHSLAFRAFYALPAQNFSTTGGQHTNAVYGFLGMFLGLMEKEQPTHVAAAFDLSGPTFREESFPAYKAQRPATPDEFKGQIGLIRRSLEALGVETIDKEAYEADDIIATLATLGQKAGMRVLICTGDRDSLQLVNDDVTVLYTL